MIGEIRLDYFSVILDLYLWLQQYQITQRGIDFSVKDGRMTFILEHPVRGRIKVEQDYPLSKRFLCHGIGLEILQHSDGEECLVYDYGGIYDSIDDCVPGDHYATTHFALLGAILYRQRKDPAILKKVKKAVEFHLKTSKDEYYFGEWGYHWDFQNYAFLETFRLLEDDLSEEERMRWIRGLKSWKENSKNPLTNWVAMRAYSALLRHKLLGTWSDIFRYQQRRRRIARARHADGCYDDALGLSRPIQYHAFTVALLHRMYLCHPKKVLKKNFLLGVRYLLAFIDPEGCFNYLGRGQEQIFGYGVGIYVLEAAKTLDEAHAELYQSYVDRMWTYLLRFRKDGHFPLVLNYRRDDEKFGWYDYHHLTVYNAFLGAWLGLAGLLLTEPAEVGKQCSDIPREFVEFFEPSKVIVASKERYFVALSGGSREYLSESGVTPLHVWFQGIGWMFSCPGGPSHWKFGARDSVDYIERNVFAPIVRMDDSEWIGPAYRECNDLRVGSDAALLVMDYGPFILHRQVLFKKGTIVFEDCFTFGENRTLPELRYFNLPVVIDKFKIDLDELHEVRLLSEYGIVRVMLVDWDFPLKDFEILERIKTAKGLATVIGLREMDFKVKRNRKHRIKFLLSELSPDGF